MTDSLIPTDGADVRLSAPRWKTNAEWHAAQVKLRVLLPVNVVLALWYFEWLLSPGRAGNPLLYGLLVTAELFNLVQAAGFWWTCRRGRVRPPAPLWPGRPPAVDVLIPVYNEPLDVVSPTVAAARRMHGREVTVLLLDDAGRDELEALAAHEGVGYVRRDGNDGAKAGNINHALRMTTSPFVAVFDCDHVPDPHFLTRTLGWMRDPAVGFVQTPQYYANSHVSPLTAAASSQQSLFFGAIAQGKDRMDAMFCCGTNVLFRREALDEVGGFPEASLTEDFQLSIMLHEQGWRSVYVNEVLAQGLGPEDMASYVSQQQRWAKGCLSALPLIFRAQLPGRMRLQYLLSAMFFLSGWSFLLYMALPVVRILTGMQPLAGTSADQFLVHFFPYFCVSLAAVAVAGAGSYTFGAFALLIATFFVQIGSSVSVLLRRRGSFVVTAKRGASGAQPRAVLPTLVVVGCLLGAVGFALHQSLTAATLNNVAFALLHVTVLATGAWPAIRGRPRSGPAGRPAEVVTVDAVAV